MVHHETTFDRGADAFRLDAGVFGRVRSILLIVAVISWVLLAIGFALDREQFYHSYLFGFTFATVIPLGAIFFVMVQYLTGSAWSVPVRRLMESLMVTLPLAIVLFLPIALGLEHIYEWANPKFMAADPILRGKAGYLNPTFFLVRAFIYFAIWSLWSWKIYSHSIRQDSRQDSVGEMNKISRWCAPGLLVCFLTVSLASFDWIMSLNPHWYSTIFGIYTYAGAGWSFMATLILICLGLRRAGVLHRVITMEQYHDLGKWLFALTVFWAYIAFSQYLLIWYANIPEETIFFKQRFEHGWGVLSVLLLFGHFIVPFLVLLPRASKRNLTVLGGMAVFVLAVHFLDHYWLIMPNFHQEHGQLGIRFHWLDLVAPVATVSAYGLLFWSRLKQHSLLPVGDVRFEEGLQFHNV